MAKGNIGITSENIFPVIKKFLYSDHEIFLREVVSNAVDATQKLKTLARVGEAKCELGELKVRVSIDKDKKTLTISDRGVGMTEEEIERYINQIAFSGATEFLNKYKEDAGAIIGHFGLGFYSAFMVSEKVEIVTKSYKDGAQAMRWECDGTPNYEMEPTEKADRGTDIILHIDGENQEFLEEGRIEGLLKKYCKFLPVEIVFGKEKEWKDGKEVETDQDHVVNNTQPAWTRKPSELKEEDYEKFYEELYPFSEKPLFHIHLNVDYPFNLTGILYFPKIKNNIEIQKNKIQLYCNQVFVTDSVEGIVPEYLTLLHGVIDSPDIPLNVSRSYLQSDANVKKISGHITKKVADRLAEIFKNDRKEFEEKWDSLKLFIQYGMLSDEKFYERAEKFALLKDTDGKYYTKDEYKTLIESEQTDKNGNIVHLYTNDKVAHYTQVEAAKAKGYNVLWMDGQLDIPAINQMEQKWEKSRFVRVDSDVVEKLIEKADTDTSAGLSTAERTELSVAFKTALPTDDGANYVVNFEKIEGGAPVAITQNEFMRRMKDASALYGGGMGYYGQMPDAYTVVVNVAHPVVKSIVETEKAACGEKINPLRVALDELEAKIADLRKAKADKKEESEDDKKALESAENEASEKRNAIEAIVKEWAATEPKIGQLTDLGLLAAGLLKGEALAKFVKRSVELLG